MASGSLSAEWVSRSLAGLDRTLREHSLTERPRPRLVPALRAPYSAAVGRGSGQPAWAHVGLSG